MPIRLCAALLAGLWLAGCAATEPKPKPLTAPMPTGQPEILVQGRTMEQIQAEARRFFTERGYQERATDHAYKLAFDRSEGGAKSEQPAGEALRVRLAVRPLGNGAHRVAGYSYRVEDWRQMLESEAPVFYGLPQVQAMLNQIKANLERSR